MAGDFYAEGIDFERFENGDPVRLFGMFREWNLTRKLEQADADSDSGTLETLLPNETGNVVRYRARVEASPPELVLYVRDRTKALDEIRKVVTGLGGEIVEDKEKAAKAIQKAERADTALTVTLRPGHYGGLRGQMRRETQSKGSVDRKLGESMTGAGGDSAGAGGITTLRIRLIEVTQEKPPPNPPQE